MEYVIAIIGGGASGLAAAIAAAENVRAFERERGVARGSAARVVLYEATDKIGRPILASGNGRCNFSNLSIDAEKYHNAAFVSDVLTAFEEGATSKSLPAMGAESTCEPFDMADSGEGPMRSNGVVRFFESHGLLWRSEPDGRLYPKTNKASSVLDVMRHALEIAGVQVQLGASVEAVEPPSQSRGNSRFTLRMRDSALEHADAVVLAVGGTASRALLAQDIPFVDMYPTLGPVATDTRWVKPLDNMRVRCAATLVRDGHSVHAEHGELLFRKYGVSGIMVFDLSRLAEAGDAISIDFMPDIPADDMVSFLCDRTRMLESAFGSVSWEALLTGMVLPSLARILLDRAGLAAEELCEPSLMWKLAEQLKSFTLEYRGVGDARSCQVHRGGFAPESVDARTMQVPAAPGLFITGEALDVDGPCGGFNLHWAFATGLMAGATAAQLARSAPKNT